jgi:8-oxo-dGTP pyrophosphatase MutT (NUDIX family)
MAVEINKKKYCINCGKAGHNNKECMEPIISAGVILFKLDEKNILDNLKRLINMRYFMEKFNRTESKKIVLNETKNVLGVMDEFTLNFLKNNISFLLVQRKYTLGYVEFLRGRYDLNNLETLVHLLNQMTKLEISMIMNNKDNFQSMWDLIWNKKMKDMYFENEYKIAKKKFDDFVATGILNELITYETKYKTPEWGFPKGRRNYRENNITCAKRELLEETNLMEDEYNILSGIYPLVEVMTGTNDKMYKHIYYIGVCDYNKEVIINDLNEIQKFEIGDIGWFTYNECMILFREYHLEKKRLLSILFSFIVGQILKQNVKKYPKFTYKVKNNQLNI